MDFKPVVNVVLKHAGAWDKQRGAVKGTWIGPNTSPHGPGATVICGDCGAWLGIYVPPMGNHTIDAYGKVSPSIGCTDCGWHIFGVLEGWKP